MEMKKFGVVGCGKMGQAMVSRMSARLPETILCCDVVPEAREEMAKIIGPRAVAVSAPDIVAQECDVVLVAVKPIHACGVLKILAGGMKKTILSIVAGLSIERLNALCPGHTCVRIMPNTPALAGCGAMAVLDSGLDDATRQLAKTLMDACGTCHFIPRESLMDAVTGLSGSGPALFAMIAEALADEGVAQGLPRATALALARETMLGTAKLLEIQHPAILKENVMSPGGTTAAGVIAAENHALRSAVQAFVRAAAEKSRELGK